MADATPFTQIFTAQAEHIDLLGHVNNAVWVQWMEAIATAHWESIASADDLDRWVWVVARHEIDYRGNIRLGESVTATTFVPEGPTGARFDRRVDFRDAVGKLIVSACTTWALIDRASGRLHRVRADLAAQFMR